MQFAGRWRRGLTLVSHSTAAVWLGLGQRDRVGKLIDKFQQHLCEGDQLLSVVSTHQGNLMCGFVSLLSDVINPAPPVRRDVALVCQEINVMNERFAFSGAFLNTNVHEKFSAQQYTGRKGPRTSARSGLLIQATDVERKVSNRPAR